MTIMILLVDNEPSFVESLSRMLALVGLGVEVAADTGAALAAITDRRFDLLLTGIALHDDPRGGLTLLRRLREVSPGTETIVIADPRSIHDALEAVRSGAFYFAEKPCDPDRLLLLVEKALERRRLAAELLSLRRHFQRDRFSGLIGASKPMQQIYAMIESLAPSEANVMIHGEAGTGKDLIASAIHLTSPRAGRQCVRVSCTALATRHLQTPPSAGLVEADLFGLAADSSATLDRSSEGLIASAAGGTLLLDEIAALPLDLQPRLLRVIEDRRYRPVGDTRTRDADFRLICTTSHDPREAIREGLLRDDLFYRISTIALFVPPLRERGEDLQMLTDHFFAEFREKYDRPLRAISPAAFRRILSYRWPGNVRELRNAIERAVLIARGSMIEPEDLLFSQSEREIMPEEFHVPPDLTLEEIEQLVIRRTLQRTGGNKLAAAKILGLHRPRLYARIRKYRLDLPGNLRPAPGRSQNRKEDR